MHSPSARALHHLERYCIILVHTLNHLMPGKCVINTTYLLREETDMASDKTQQLTD